MTDGNKNVPFAIGDDDDDDNDVFSSVEVHRSNENAPGVSGGDVRASGALAAKPTSQPAPTVRSSGPIAAPAASVRRPVLTVETSGGTGARQVEIANDAFSIGRRGVDLEIADQYALPFHAQITMQKGAAFLRPVAVHNGVFLRIADDLQLEDWDEISVGTQRFVFRTTWDRPEEPENPNLPYTPAIGGNLPPDAARLIQMYAGSQVGAVYRLKDNITIGRQNADVCEPEDQWLSTPHALIERRDDKFFIKDANSQHGTFIRVLDTMELISGDEFMVGRTRIKIAYP